MPDRLDECLERGLVDLVRRQRHLPEARRSSRRRPRACPTTACWSRPTRPYLTPQAVRKERNQPGVRRAHRALRRRGARRRATRSSTRGVERNAAAAVRLVSAVRRPQPSLRAACAQLRAFGIRPNRDLGQNFLVDSNILGVIERAAELAPDDVVLEIGGGLGVLSEHLAERVRARPRRRGRPRARAGAARRARRRTPNTTLHFADAMALDLAALDPAPTKVVANLPYGIAASAILRTIEELPGVTRWVAMVQSEVGERLAAAPGTARLRRALGARAARLRGARAAARSRAPSSTRCRTSTRCSSCSSAAARRRRPSCARSSSAAFAHRRKALAALARARRRRADPASRERARAALERARPSRRRARRAPLARGLPRAVRRRSRRDRPRERAPGEDQPLPVPRAGRARDGRHELVSRHAVARARRRARARAAPTAPRDEVVCAGVEGAEPRRRRARGLPRGDGLGRRRRCG